MSGNTLFNKWKNRLGSKYYYYPKVLAAPRIFNGAHDYPLDLKNPRTIDEKVRWLLTYSYGRREAPFADKVLAREYVKKCGYEHMLVKLYGVYKKTADIRPDALPNKFVIKTNHDSGSVYICRDKSTFDWDAAMHDLNERIKVNYANRYCEYHYKYIKRRILIEELLEDEERESLLDYKVHCIHGKPICIEVITDRATGYKENYYDPSWNRLEWAREGQSKGNTNVPKPKRMEEMLAASAKLSAPFTYARIDFYVIQDQIYMGEITLTPSNSGDMSDEAQLRLGEMCTLPTQKEIALKNRTGYTY